MSTPEQREALAYLNPAGEVTGQALDALPPEIKALLKPGKVTERIQHAVTWSSRRDPLVVSLHHARNRKIQTFEDIGSAPVGAMDAIARHIARRYRRRALLTGAITSLPGGLWAIVATGADVQLTATYSVRMAALIAQAYGYDTSLFAEQAHLADVLALVAGVDGLRGVGNFVTREGLERLLPELLPHLIARLSVRITEEQAAVWIGRVIPGVGAVVGGVVDYTFVRVAGERAIAYYHNRALIERQSLSVSPAAPAAFSAPPASAALAASTSTADSAASTLPPELARVAVVPAGATTPATPATMPHRYRRPPERFAVYLGIFAALAMLITIAACVALGFLVYGGVQHLHLVMLMLMV